MIRGQKVMIDEDLDELYGVPTKRLNQQVSRNRKRFPDDFMFRLNKTEAENLRLQFATSRSGHGGRRSFEQKSRRAQIKRLRPKPSSDE